MVKIYVGSQNPAKIDSVKQVFSEDEVVGMDVESKVAAQPFSDEETLEGAINRARECAAMNKGNFGIGLEGGVMEIEDDLYLCNWGALVDNKENVFTASGARIPLPDEIKKELEKGRELGDVMDDYANKNDVRKNEGAIGIFTNGAIEREEMFRHVVKLLKGQWEFYQ
ncbi:NTPase [Halobacillus sp. BBL2006]|nr:NTPase [Halobacillus sp. BBL2006]